MSDAEEVRLLRAFWDQFWNGPGSTECSDGGECHDTAAAFDLTAKASAVDEFYSKHGYPDGLDRE